MSRITGNIIEEIKGLPSRQVHHFGISSAEEKLENGIITPNEAVDICTQISMDYLKNKQSIIEGIKERSKILIVDAIMGSGKSTYMIDKVINKNPQQHFLCVLPTLDECERYRKQIEAITYQPQPIGGRKKNGLHQLIANGQNIVTTHALIQHIDPFTMDLLKKSDYILIIDECLDVVHQYERNFKTSDLKSIFEDGYVTTDEKGFLIWNDDKEKGYDGRWNDIKHLCKLRSLMRMKKGNGNWSDTILMWNFPVIFFSLFEKCYICTYLWNGSMQKAYFDMHKIEYFHMTLSENRLSVYNPTREFVFRKRYCELINLYSGKLNAIGVPDDKNGHPLSATWYRNQAKNANGKSYLAILKSNTYNYFRNIIRTSSDDNMYTTFKQYKKHIQGATYTKGFVACSAKGTNDYRHKQSLAYLINYFPPPNIVKFFKAQGIELNQDLWSLSELLQWIWRSRIREGQCINLYLPSQRMRELLGLWAIGRI